VQDHATFSLQCGTHPLIARGRRRLEALPGAMELLTGMVCYAPSGRPTMLSIIQSRFFTDLVEPLGLDAPTRVGSLDFMAFMDANST
jgi:hypothetical protein